MRRNAKPQNTDVQTMSSGPIISNGAAVLNQIDHVLDNDDDRKKLHENIYFGSDIKEQWNFLVTSADLNSHNMFMGVPRLGDQVLYYQQRAVSVRPFGWRSEIIAYPMAHAVHLRPAVISGISVIDSFKNGRGGEARIIRGGVGASFVEIELQSRWFQGYAFTVVIIGQYMDSKEGARSAPTINNFSKSDDFKRDNIKLNIVNPL